MSWRDIIKAFPKVVHDKEGEAFHFVGRQGNLGKYSNGEREVLLDEKNAKILAPSEGLTMRDNTTVQIDDDEAGTSLAEYKEGMAGAVTTSSSPALFNTTYGQRKKKKEDEK